MNPDTCQEPRNAAVDQETFPTDASILPHRLYYVNAMAGNGRRNVARNSSTLPFPMLKIVELKPTTNCQIWRIATPLGRYPPRISKPPRHRPSTLEPTQIPPRFFQIWLSDPHPCCIKTHPLCFLVPCCFFIYLFCTIHAHDPAGSDPGN